MIIKGGKMATDETKKAEVKDRDNKKSESQPVATRQNVAQPQSTQLANKGMGGGLLAFVVCSFIIGGCNIITALYYTMKSFFLGWNDYNSILNAIVSIVMAVCFLMAAIEMVQEKREGKKLAEIALIAALVCSVITAVPGMIDGFPRQRTPSINLKSTYSGEYDEDGYSWPETIYGTSSKESLAAEQSLYVVTWVMIIVVRAGLVGLLLAYLEKSERIKNTLVK